MTVKKDFSGGIVRTLNLWGSFTVQAKFKGVYVYSAKWFYLLALAFFLQR